MYKRVSIEDIVYDVVLPTKTMEIMEITSKSWNRKIPQVGTIPLWENMTLEWGLMSTCALYVIYGARRRVLSYGP